MISDEFRAHRGNTVGRGDCKRLPPEKLTAVDRHPFSEGRQNRQGAPALRPHVRHDAAGKGPAASCVSRGSVTKYRPSEEGAKASAWNGELLNPHSIIIHSCDCCKCAMRCSDLCVSLYDSPKGHRILCPSGEITRPGHHLTHGAQLVAPLDVSGVRIPTR